MKNFPQKVKEERSERNGGQIDQDSPAVPKQICYLPEHPLLHGGVGADVKHVDGSQRMKENIAGCGDETASKIEQGAVFEFFPCIFDFVGQPCRQSHNNQENMPCIGVKGQWRITVVHAAGIKKGKNTAEQAVIHKKGQTGIPVSDRRKKGQQKAEIHGKAAKLKRKIPPIIGTVI